MSEGTRRWVIDRIPGVPKCVKDRRGTRSFSVDNSTSGEAGTSNTHRIASFTHQNPSITHQMLSITHRGFA